MLVLQHGHLDVNGKPALQLVIRECDSCFRSLACVTLRFFGWALKAIKASEGRETARRLGRATLAISSFAFCFCSGTKIILHSTSIYTLEQ